MTGRIAMHLRVVSQQVTQLHQRFPPIVWQDAIADTLQELLNCSVFGPHPYVDGHSIVCQPSPCRASSLPAHTFNPAPRWSSPATYSPNSLATLPSRFIGALQGFQDACYLASTSVKPDAQQQPRGLQTAAPKKDTHAGALGTCCCYMSRLSLVP